LGPWLFLLSDDGLVAINFKKRTVKLLWKAPDLVSAAVTDKDPMAAMKRLLDKATQSMPLLLVRTQNQVVGLDMDGRELERHVIPPELRDDQLEWHRLSDGRVLVRRLPYDNELFWIDAAGKIVRHEKVNLRVKRKFHRPWPNGIAHFTMVMFVVPSPAAIVGTLVCNPWDIYNTPWRTRSLGYSAALRQALCDAWLLLSVNGTVSEQSLMAV